MAKWNNGIKNGMWKGGKILASNGYVLIRVGTGHPMADVRGYAYEHRIIVSEQLGRVLGKQEHVHHINGDKTDNRSENLLITSGIVEHRSLHRKSVGLRPYGENNPMRQCECGCTKWFAAYDSSNRPRNYISGHNPHPSNTLDSVLEILQNGESSAIKISEYTKKSLGSIKTALSKLHKQGKIFHVKHGIWKINNGT